MSEILDDVDDTALVNDLQRGSDFGGSEIQPDEAHPLTVFGGILSIISTIVGGGIVGLPFAFYMLGLLPGFIFMCLMGAQTINSVWLYLRAKDLIPGKPESLYEIGYILFQRKAIFMISSILVLNSLGMVMVYFIIFGKTMGGIYGAIFIGVEANIEHLTGFQHFMTHRIPYIVILATCLLPIMIKKQLQELHIVSVCLFVAIMIFVAILCFQLLILGGDVFSKECLTKNDNDECIWTPSELDFQQILWPGEDATFLKQIKSCVTAMVAFSFANNIFPIYSSLAVKTNVNMAKVSSLSIGLVFLIYTLLSLVCLLLFGEQIDKGTNVMNSVNNEILMNPKRKESFALQLLFMVVLACHIPFIFFSGKEALCIIIDELDRRSISHTLDERIAFLQNKAGNGKIISGLSSHQQTLESEGNQSTEQNDLIKSRVSNQRSSQFLQRTGSIQSQLRATLQLRKTNSRATLRDGTLTSQGANKGGARISIIRETQSLRRPPAVIDEEGRKSRMTATGMQPVNEDDEEDGGLAYLDMKDKYYYGATLTYFFIIVFGAITIPSVDTIFEFVGSICINCLSFFFPGIFYLFANWRYKQNRQSVIDGFNNPDKTASGKDYKMVVSAYAQIVIGCFAFVLGMISNISGLIHKE